MIIDLFAGPGGVDEGLRLLGATDVIGIEWDADACATAEAAGHRRVQADVAELDPHDYPCDGLWASPSCQAWSMAGKRTAQGDQARLGRHVEACRPGWKPYDPADYADVRTPLVLEPLRWADVLRPRWLALEQVPPVLDLWGHYADVLRGWGYAVWCGVLNAADCGIVDACPLHATHSPSGSVDSAGSPSRFATALATAERAATTKPDEAWPPLAATVAGLLASRIRPAFADAATPAERGRRLEALVVSAEQTTHAGREVADWTSEATSAFGVTTDVTASIASLLNSALADPSVSARWSTTSTETRRTTVLRTSRSIAATLTTGCGTGPATREAGCGLCVDIATPQTRRRAVLMARRDGPVEPPDPTHAQHPEPAGLFGAAKLPWVTMAQALGWDDGRTAAPMRGAGMVDRHGERRAHPMGEPAPTVRANGGGNATPGWQWQFVAAGETGEGRPRDPDEHPAATLSGKGTAYWVNGNQANSAVRWVHERPATSVQGDPRIGRPGHKDRELGEQQFAEGSVRVTIEQAAVLQSFRADYPWRGSKTSRFAQVGNAVPPPLAAAICAGLVEPSRIVNCGETVRPVHEPGRTT